MSGGCVLLIAIAVLQLTPRARASVHSQTGGHGAAQQPAQDEATAAFDEKRAYEHVRKLVEFGPRPSGSKQLEKSREYIVAELKKYGLKVTTDEFKVETPAGRRKMVNVTAEVAGDSADFIILASHYDTKLFKNLRFVGANDGGSSTGVLLELARAISSTARKPRFGYRLVFFDGEEAVCREWDECSKPGAPDNTYGSRRYVAALQERDELKRLRAMILLDMVGYRRLQLGRDSMSTKWLVDVIWQAARERGYGEQFVEREEGIGGDDHEPFLKAGVPAVDIIQLNSYPHWHTAEDTLDKIAPRSLKVVGDAVLSSLPRVEEALWKKDEGRMKTGASKQ
ncbi:MAG TPA: M28 family peptidase [Pyrinomonadaceae bacterium]